MRLLLFLLKCLVGLFAAVGFLVVAAAFAGYLAWDRLDPLRGRVGTIPETAILTLDLGAGVVERRPDHPLARASLGNVLVLRKAVDALDAAGRDPRVRGLLIKAGRGGLGLAQAQELRAAVERFKDQDKAVLAFAESFAEGGNGTVHYYLASVADEIWLQPSGELDITGFLLQSPFLRGALNELEVRPRLAQREEYKGAANVFTDSALPEPQRRNLEALVNSWLDQVVAGIAAGRGLAAERVRTLIDGAPHGAATAKAEGLVDQLGYRDEAEAVLLQAAEVSDAQAPAALLPLTDYGAWREAPEEQGPALALVYGLGAILSDESQSDPLFGRLVMGADTVSRAIHDAVRDPEVRAIVFRVDSPGGSYVASDTIWRAVRWAQSHEKPVIVSMGGLAASGGYFVAAPANAIVAEPATITGSIGVAAGKMVVSGLWDKLGVNWDGVAAGKNADFWSANQDFSPAQWDQLEASLDRSYEDFLAKVAEGRSLPLERVIEAAKGQVWTGADAKELGLVDALGGLHEAVGLARQAAGLSAEQPVRLKLFPEEREPFDILLDELMAGGLESPGAVGLARALARGLHALAPLLHMLDSLSADPRGSRLRAPELVGSG